jgi:hypothetical protein
MIWTGILQVRVAEARERIKVIASKKRGSELSVAQQRGIVLSGALQLMLLGAALADIYRRPREKIRGNNKVLWTLVSFVNFVGPLSYFLFGRKQ